MRAWKRAGLTMMIAAMWMSYLMNKITGRGDESEEKAEDRRSSTTKPKPSSHGLQKDCARCGMEQSRRCSLAIIEKGCAALMWGQIRDLQQFSTTRPNKRINTSTMWVHKAIVNGQLGKDQGALKQGRRLLCIHRSSCSQISEQNNPIPSGPHLSSHQINLEP